MEYKTEISELVSEFMLDVILLVGKLGGGKAKSGIIVIGVLRLVGWEFRGLNNVLNNVVFIYYFSCYEWWW